MGMHRADTATFFGPSSRHQQVLAERRELLATHPERHLALLPQGEEVLDEAMELLGASSQASLPTDRLREWSQTLEPDLLLMRADEQGALRLVGGALCFPSRWSLPEKMGKTMAEIHEVVPGLNEKRGRAIDTFLQNMAPGTAWGRSNWGMSPADDLNQHPETTVPRFSQVGLQHGAWLRLEHQIFLPLPRSKGLLFSIAIDNRSLVEILKDPELARSLARQLGTMPEDMAVYKGIDPVREQLQQVLRNQA